MVSEIGPIVAYIRYILSAEPVQDKAVAAALTSTSLKEREATPILIIEEPEAHLHPENQIKMTEIYAELSSFGVKIIMTSHSNYVFNKLSNIVISKTLAADKVKCDIFEETDEGTIGVSLDINEFGLDDQNFVDASEKLLNEKMELFSNIEF
jgi:predicted ATPase